MTGHLEGVDLLVASAGGHFEQLKTLLEVALVSNRRQVWVTYDVPQTRSMLGQDPTWVRAFHPTTKNIPNAIRNYRLARRTFREVPVARVISTGAGVSVPFILRARQLGIPAYYIESATRSQGPSLSGRFLQQIPGVQLLRQSGGWGGPRWRPGPSVFDGFSASEVGADAGPTSVLVSLGTHRFPFQALLERLEIVLPSTVQVTRQFGSTEVNKGHGSVDDVAVMPPEALRQAAALADVVVGHAGVGLALTALSVGKVPVLVPRRRSRGEHTDDHQVELAQELDSLGLAVMAEVEELTFEHLERAASLRVVHHEPPPFELVD